LTKGAEEQEQVIAVSKVPRRELRSMLRRWRLLDLDEWEPLSGSVTLSSGTPGIRLYDDDLDADVRKDAEERLTGAARLYAMELEIAEPVYLVSHCEPRSLSAAERRPGRTSSAQRQATSIAATCICRS